MLDTMLTVGIPRDFVAILEPAEEAYGPHTLDTNATLETFRHRMPRVVAANQANANAGAQPVPNYALNNNTSVKIRGGSRPHRPHDTLRVSSTGGPRKVYLQSDTWPTPRRTRPQT